MLICSIFLLFYLEIKTESVLKTYFEREMIPNQIMHVYNSDYYPRPVWSLFPKLPFETGEVETILNNSIYTTTDEDQRLVPPFFE